MNGLAGAWGRIWERVKSDFAANPGVWVGVVVSTLVLYFVWSSYQQSQTGSGLSTPANGYGSPDWGAAVAGDAPGAAPSNSELQNEFASLQAYLQNPGTPNPPGTSAPGSPSSSSSSGATSSFSSPSADSFPTPAATPAAPVANPVQNPLAPAQLLHRLGITAFPPPAPSAATGGPIQNPLAAAQMAHRGNIAAPYVPSSVPSVPIYPGTPPAPTATPLPTPTATPSFINSLRYGVTPVALHKTNAR